MKIISHIWAILLLFLIVFAFSCRRVEVEKNTNPQRYADSQVVGSWTITSVLSDMPYDWDGNGTSETDVYATWTDCEKDNLYQLVGTKTGTYKMSCSSTRNGTWLIENTLVLVLNPEGGIPLEETIISMTANSFRTTSIKSPVPNSRFTVTKVWTRK